MEHQEKWTLSNIPDQSGKKAIVTGANTGIGYEMAKALYEAGAEVIIASRDKNKGEQAAAKIKATATKGESLQVALLDLADLNDVERFALNYRSNHGKLDLLINNAGVMIPPPSKTAQGFELQFGVNFLGHFALTAHLYNLLQAASEARIVTLSSGAAIRADGIDFDNLKLEKKYDAWQAYAVSKLADVIFAYEFDRRLKNASEKIISVAAHPGVTRTDLQRHIPEKELEGLFEQFPDVMEPWQGALPALFGATAPSVRGGEFFGPDGDKEYTGYPALSKHSTPAMLNEKLAADLWKYAESATNLKLL